MRENIYTVDLWMSNVNDKKATLPRCTITNMAITVNHVASSLELSQAAFKN